MGKENLGQPNKLQQEIEKKQTGTTPENQSDSTSLENNKKEESNETKKNFDEARYNELMAKEQDKNTRLTQVEKFELNTLKGIKMSLEKNKVENTSENSPNETKEEMDSLTLEEKNKSVQNDLKKAIDYFNQEKINRHANLRGKKELTPEEEKELDEFNSRQEHIWLLMKDKQDLSNQINPNDPKFTQEKKESNVFVWNPPKNHEIENAKKRVKEKIEKAAEEMNDKLDKRINDLEEKTNKQFVEIEQKINPENTENTVDNTNGNETEQGKTSEEYNSKKKEGDIVDKRIEGHKQKTQEIELKIAQLSTLSKKERTDEQKQELKKAKEDLLIRQERIFFLEKRRRKIDRSIKNYELKNASKKEKLQDKAGQVKEFFKKWYEESGGIKNKKFWIRIGLGITLASASTVVFASGVPVVAAASFGAAASISSYFGQGLGRGIYDNHIRSDFRKKLLKLHNNRKVEWDAKTVSFTDKDWRYRQRRDKLLNNAASRITWKNRKKKVAQFIGGSIAAFGMGGVSRGLYDLVGEGMFDGTIPDTSNLENTDVQETNPQDSGTEGGDQNDGESLEENETAESGSTETEPFDTAHKDRIFIGRGEGIIHAFERQIQASAELQEHFGLSEGYSQTELDNAAFKAAQELGYVSPEGAEVRVYWNEGAGYELSVDGDNLSVQEYEDIHQNADGSWEGTKVEHHRTENGFEGDGHDGIEDKRTGTDERYEYLHSGNATGEIEEAVSQMQVNNEGIVSDAKLEDLTPPYNPENYLDASANSAAGLAEGESNINNWLPTNERLSGQLDQTVPLGEAPELISTPDTHLTYQNTLDYRDFTGNIRDLPNELGGWKNNTAGITFANGKIVPQEILDLFPRNKVSITDGQELLDAMGLKINPDNSTVFHPINNNNQNITLEMIYQRVDVDKVIENLTTIREARG